MAVAGKVGYCVEKKMDIVLCYVRRNPSVTHVVLLVDSLHKAFM
uniref:Uncharacterized protein n=1 Tax=Anguilla anguilla TaxID=7936 RepID=A0A0E9TWB2_ANGAN